MCAMRVVDFVGTLYDHVVLIKKAVEQYPSYWVRETYLNVQKMDHPI